MSDFVELQEQRERQQLEQIGAAMGDKMIAWQMFDFISCMSKQGHPTARKIVMKVMTYEPPKAGEYMELTDTEVF
jgi:hypothetical protein